MGTFEVARGVRATPAQVWAVVTDWSGYARWLPMTTMRLDRGPARVGYSFSGLTGVGPLRFADSMIITQWQPPSGPDGPAHFRLRKTGRLLDGWAVVSVQPRPGGAWLEWTEDITVRPVSIGRLLAPVSDPLNRVLFGRAVAAMAGAAEEEHRRGEPR